MKDHHAHRFLSCHKPSSFFQSQMNMYTTSLHLISFLSCISLVLEISKFLCTRHGDTHLSPPDSRNAGHDITMPCYEIWMQNVSLFSAAQNTHLKPFSRIYFSDLSHAEYIPQVQKPDFHPIHQGTDLSLSSLLSGLP